MRYLRLRLRGPMAAFGDHTSGGRRPTEPLPGRSHVLGILHACLGTRRDDVGGTDAVVAGVRMAVAGSAQGTLEDYQTVEGVQFKGNQQVTPRSMVRARLPGFKTHTAITRRAHLEDLDAVVVLWGPDEVLDRLLEATQHPVFMPYLGRRACPLAAPLSAHIVEDAPTLAEAFAAPWPIDDPEAPTFQPTIMEADDHPAPGVDEVGRYVRHDVPAGNLGHRRVYQIRVVHRHEVPPCS